MGDASGYLSLGYTDHLIFLTLHTIKHFIINGMGVRMMLDMALFFSKYKEKIDFERYWQILQELNYTNFVNVVLWSLIDTGCFDSSEFPGIGTRDSLGIQMMLYDLQIGGHMGIKGVAPDGSYEYSRQVMLKSQSQRKYWWHMLCMKIRDASQYMFPDRDGLGRIYPVLYKHKWMLFFLRIHRAFVYPIQKIAAGDLTRHLRSDSTELPEEAKRRIELFKTLGMF